MKTPLAKHLLMRRSLPVCAKLVLAFFLLARIAPELSGQELLLNGTFEAGSLAPWSVGQVAGSSIGLSAESSPFTPIYPAGHSAVRLNDDDSNFDQPTLSQTFAAQSGISFGFDFKVLAGESQSPWYVAWQGEGATTAFFFSLGGADGTSIEFNQERIAELKTNAWYHVEGWADAPRQTVRGAVVSNGGERADFQGGFPFGLSTVMNALEVSDGDAGRNPSILFDNFTTRPISLEINRNPAGEAVVTWALADFRLQSAAALGTATNWTDVVSVAGIYTNTFPERQRFFRLVR